MHFGSHWRNVMFTGTQQGMCPPAISPKAFEAAMQKPTTLTGSSSPLMSRMRTPLAPKPFRRHKTVSKGRSRRCGLQVAWWPATPAPATALPQVVLVQQCIMHQAGREDGNAALPITCVVTVGACQTVAMLGGACAGKVALSTLYTTHHEHQVKDCIVAQAGDGLVQSVKMPCKTSLEC